MWGLSSPSSDEETGRRQPAVCSLNSQGQGVEGRGGPGSAAPKGHVSGAALGEQEGRGGGRGSLWGHPCGVPWNGNEVPTQGRAGLRAVGCRCPARSTHSCDGSAAGAGSSDARGLRAQAWTWGAQVSILPCRLGPWPVRSLRRWT